MRVKVEQKQDNIESQLKTKQVVQEEQDIHLIVLPIKQ